MICSGIDILDISRIERSIKNERFKKFVYGKSELAELETKGFPPQSAAAAFAAKEAFSKAIGLGIRKFSLNEVEVLHEANGKPYLHFSGRAKVLTDESGYLFSVSISHTKDVAVAVVIGFSNKS